MSEKETIQPGTMNFSSLCFLSAIAVTAPDRG
jgi:hypothetical protein